VSSQRRVGAHSVNRPYGRAPNARNASVIAMELPIIMGR